MESKGDCHTHCLVSCSLLRCMPQACFHASLTALLKQMRSHWCDHRATLTIACTCTYEHIKSRHLQNTLKDDEDTKAVLFESMGLEKPAPPAAQQHALPPAPAAIPAPTAAPASRNGNGRPVPVPQKKEVLVLSDFLE